jgi:hypothetical protein
MEVVRQSQLGNMIMKSLAKPFFLSAALAVSGFAASSASAANIMFVMDASGSMKKDAGNGFSRMDNAQHAIARMLTDVDDSNRYGLTVYGHRSARTCSDIQVVAHVGSVSAGFVNEFVQELKPIGETPIAESVKLAAASFEKFSGQDNQIVLVTDGLEACGGDVCSLADTLARYHVGLKVNVVGFTLNRKQQSMIRCLSDMTGGKYYDAKDGPALERAFTQVKQEIVAATPVAAKPVAKKPKASTESGVWFRDNFNGDRLGDHWLVQNEAADQYAVEDGKLLVIFPDTGKSTVTGATAKNVLRLKKPMPKGDWTATARFVFTAQTQGEWLRFGVSDGVQSSLLGSYEMTTYNWALTYANLRIDKMRKGKSSGFAQRIKTFKTRDVAARSKMFSEAIKGMLLKLVKKGRSYTIYGKLEGPANANWISLQKVASIKSPGKMLTLMFGNQTNGYAPKNGEGLVEIDWVEVTTP